MIPNEERERTSLSVLIFALNMLVHTDAGGTYTFSELEEWLKEAGFPSVEMSRRISETRAGWRRLSRRSEATKLG